MLAIPNGIPRSDAAFVTGPAHALGMSMHEHALEGCCLIADPQGAILPAAGSCAASAAASSTAWDAASRARCAAFALYSAFASSLRARHFSPMALATTATEILAPGSAAASHSAWVASRCLSENRK